MPTSLQSTKMFKYSFFLFISFNYHQFKFRKVKFLEIEILQTQTFLNQLKKCFPKIKNNLLKKSLKKLL